MFFLLYQNSKELQPSHTFESFSVVYVQDLLEQQRDCSFLSEPLLQKCVLVYEWNAREDWTAAPKVGQILLEV